MSSVSMNPDEKGERGQINEKSSLSLNPYQASEGTREALAAMIGLPFASSGSSICGSFCFGRLTSLS
jgi:hypothetical protein